jgi:hypothetical protein
VRNPFARSFVDWKVAHASQRALPETGQPVSAKRYLRCCILAHEARGVIRGTMAKPESSIYTCRRPSTRISWYSYEEVMERARVKIGRYRIRRRVAVGAAIGMIAAASVGIGRVSSYGAVRQAHLTGDVLLCPSGDAACSPLAANVNLFRMEDGVARAVARQFARDGHFSFLVAPGQYVPTAEVIGAQAVRVQCLTSRVVVRSGEYARADVRCRRRLRR